MKFSLLPVVAAVAGTTVALNLEAPGAELGHTSNRPFKRQSGWSPPSNLQAPLKQVWDHVSSTYNGGNVFSFKNYGWDQIKATGGKINYCVRWESSDPVSEVLRAQIAAKASEAYQDWFKWAYGYDGFPYSKIEVNVVGWAVRDKSLLQGSTSGLDIYTDKDSEGAPQCAPACGRFFHQDNNYSGCSGGAARHYDQSLWITDDSIFGGGAGGDWGQRIQKSIFMREINSRPMTYIQHEMGHTFGLDDFYDWKPSGVGSFIMDEGLTIVDFDGWMFRNFWYELKRNRGW